MQKCGDVVGWLSFKRTDSEGDGTESDRGVMLLISWRREVSPFKKVAVFLILKHDHDVLRQMHTNRI